MKKTNFSSYLFFLFFAFFPIASVSATDAYVLEIPLQGENVSVAGPAEYIRMIFLFGLGIVGVVALFAVVWGGIRYLTSGSSETGKTEGKRWIIGALSGVVLLFSSYLILNTINPELVSFKEPHLDRIYIQATIDNYDPVGAGTYTPPITGNISSTMQNLSQFQEQINPDNTLVLIDKSDQTLYVYVNGQPVAQSPIGIGINDQSGSQIGGISGDRITPVGDFTITNDRRYSPSGVFSGQFGSNMGPSFIGLSCVDQNGNYRGIGIHGSADDSLRPTYGCIRVKNADVIELYKNIPAGTPVKIRN